MNTWLGTLILAIFGMAGCQQTEESAIVLGEAESAVGPEEDRVIPTRAYLAVTGSSGDMALGHSFIVLTYDNNLLGPNSIAYHFMVMNLDDPKAPLSYAEMLKKHWNLPMAGKDYPIPYEKGTQPFAFSIDRNSFSETYLNMIHANRSTILLRLKLNPEQLDQLAEELDLAYELRKQRPIFDYNLLSHNCVHAPVNLLNKVLERPIEVPEWSSLSVKLESLRSKANFVPLFFLYNVMTYRPDIVDPAELIVQNHQQEKISHELMTLDREVRSFFGLLETTQGMTYSPKLIEEGVIPGLGNGASSLPMLKQLFKQVYQPAQERVSEEQGPLALEHFHKAQCKALVEGGLSLTLDGFHAMDAITVMHHLRPERALRYIKHNSETFAYFRDKDDATIDEELAIPRHFSRYKRFSKSAMDCIENRSEEMVAYLETMLALTELNRRFIRLAESVYPFFDYHDAVQDYRRQLVADIYEQTRGSVNRAKESRLAWEQVFGDLPQGQP